MGTEHRKNQQQTRYEEDFFHNNLITMPADQKRGEPNFNKANRPYPRLSFPFFAHEKRQAILGLQRISSPVFLDFFEHPPLATLLSFPTQFFPGLMQVTHVQILFRVGRAARQLRLLCVNINDGFEALHINA